jgi:hypothetical protein
MTACPECRYLQHFINNAANLRLKALYAEQLLRHKLNAHPHERVQDLPELSPALESITDRDN